MRSWYHDRSGKSRWNRDSRERLMTDSRRSLEPMESRRHRREAADRFDGAWSRRGSGKSRWNRDGGERLRTDWRRSLEPKESPAPGEAEEGIDGAWSHHGSGKSRSRWPVSDLENSRTPPPLAVSMAVPPATK